MEPESELWIKESLRKHRVAEHPTGNYKGSTLSPQGMDHVPSQPEEEFLNICQKVDELEESVMDLLSITKLFLQLGMESELELMQQSWLRLLPSLLESTQKNLRTIPKEL